MRMVFGFLKKNKKDNNSKSKTEVDEGYEFWLGCMETNIVKNPTTGEIEKKESLRIPFKDITDHFFDETDDYLKNVVKNDSDVHRRTAATVLLAQSSKKNFSEFFMSLTWELDLHSHDYDSLDKDIANFFKAKRYGGVIISP